MMTKQEFAARLSAKLVERRMPYTELALRAGLPRNNVKTYLDARSFPADASLKKMAEVLRCTPDDLLPDRLELVLHGEGFPDLWVAPSYDPEYRWLTVHRLIHHRLAEKIVRLLQDEREGEV